jgi:hypothetical protein
MTVLTHYVNFHNEGILSVPAISSALASLNKAGSVSPEINLVAILDNVDEITREIVTESKAFKEILETDFGDLGSARNFAALSGESEFLSFQDGDDLIGEMWLGKGLSYLLSAERDSGNLILHPEYALYFYEREFDIQFQGNRKSFFMRYTSSNAPYLDPKVLLFNNIYTSNFMSSRNIVLNNQLPKVDKENNWGVEDWTWNSQTFARGIIHEVVKNTVHAVRVKEENSLGLENAKKNLLPDTRECMEKILDDKN